MLRGLTDATFLFVLPFLLYGAVLLLKGRLPVLGARWTQPRFVQLGLAGLALVLGMLVIYGLRAPRREGAYVPAHLDGGRLVPGQIE